MRARGDRRLAPRRRSPALSRPSDVKALYFGTYDRASPRNAQVISCLRGAGVEVVEQHRDVWERATTGRSGLAPARACRAGRARARLRARQRARRGRVIVGYPGHFDLPAGEAGRAGAAGRLQPARLAPRHARRRPGAVPARRRPRAGCCALVDRRRVPARRSRRRRHRGPRAVLPAASSACATSGSRSRFVGAEDSALPAGLAAARAVPCALRRQADPAPRARDDPRRGRARARDPVPRRRRRPARAAPRASGRRTSTTCPGSTTTSSRRRSRRAGCALGIFGTGDEGGARDPEQGLPGARLRAPARHRRHARRARAPDRRPRRAARAAGDPAPSPRRSVGSRATPRSRDALGAAGRETYEARASEDGARRALARAARAGDRRRVTRRRARCSRVGAVRVRGRVRGARHAPAAGLRDRPLRRRQPRPGRLVDGTRRLPRGDRSRRACRSRGSAPTSTRSSRVRAALVAVARPGAAARRPGASASRPARSPVFLLARRHLGSEWAAAGLRARLPPLPADAVARPRRLPSRSRSRRRCCSGRSGSSTSDRLVAVRARSPAPPA